jgi:hypothetical protein
MRFENSFKTIFRALREIFLPETECFKAFCCVRKEVLIIQLFKYGQDVGSPRNARHNVSVSAAVMWFNKQIILSVS